MTTDSYSYSVPTIVIGITELIQYPRRKTHKFVFDILRVSLTLRYLMTYVFSSLIPLSIEGTES